MSKKNQQGCGCLVILVVVLAVAASMLNSAKSPYMIGAVVVGAMVVLGACAYVMGKSSRCGICGSEIRRKSYSWNIDGTRTTVCPRCNSRMENRKSRDSFRERFGD